MKETAIYAYGVLDFIGCDLVAASEAFRHFQSAEIRASISQHTPAPLNRLCLNHIFIALSRYQEFYQHFARYIPEEYKNLAKQLFAEIEKRDLRIFRNEFLAHIWSKQYDRPLTGKEIVDAAQNVASDDFSQFVNWIHDFGAEEGTDTVVKIIERLRDAFSQNYGLTDQDIAPGLFD